MSLSEANLPGEGNPDAPAKEEGRRCFAPCVTARCARLHRGGKTKAASRRTIQKNPLTPRGPRFDLHNLMLKNYMPVDTEKSWASQEYG